MCSLFNLFKNSKSLEEMSETEINKYINTLNKKIEQETVTSRITEYSDSEKNRLYEKIKKRDDAIIYLEKKQDKSELH